MLVSVAPLRGQPQVQIFSSAAPRLTDEHGDRREIGMRVQRDWLEALYTRYGLIISSAIRSEMVMTGCSYETACVRFVQEADRFTADIHWVEMGTEQLIAQGDLEKPD